jgi:hypothetical protein
MYLNFNRFAIEKHNDIVLLYFDLEINNTAEDIFDFNPGIMQVEVNGKLSKATYYDSLASVMPEMITLEKGKSEYKLYFVFPKEINTDRIEKFKFINNGLIKCHRQSENALLPVV